MNIKNRKQEVEGRIRKACAKVNRNPENVRVIGVTKYLNYENTEKVIISGIDHIGESRIQDAKLKIDKMEFPATWHFIGGLQSNKVKDVVRRFNYLHSLDRYSLALDLNKHFKKNRGTLKCFIQVNVSGEKSKRGIFPYELKDFIHEVKSTTEVELIGLMTMAPKVANVEEVRPVFRKLRNLQEEMFHLYGFITHLSMGMSQDYEVAIEEGATWIRLGTELVGNSEVF